MIPSPSLWEDQIGERRTRRPPLSGDVDVDVAIVGAGFTGLWTALYLSRLAPDARILVVDAAIVGYGASGRNGGWCIGELAGSDERWRSAAGEDGVRRMHRAMVDTVREVERVTGELGIDCDFALGGAIHLARNGGQAERLRRDLSGDMRWMDAAEASAAIGATSIHGALFDPHTAALHPGKLVVGLAEACEAVGVTIHEDTRATRISTGLVETERGRISCDHVVNATEAYTTTLSGRRRDLVPFYSLMIGTEPLSDDLLDQVRLVDRQTFSDARYRVIYGQRTADGRLAFGGRAAAYRFGSAIDRATELSPRAHGIVHETLLELFPFLAGVEITHQWGGVLGVPRNWTPSVGADRVEGVWRAGGYVGEGVAATNLAGRCLAHLIARTGEDLTTLPWVRPPSRRWPVEPFRWFGIQTGSALFESADRREARNDRRAPEADFVWKYLRR